MKTTTAKRHCIILADSFFELSFAILVLLTLGCGNPGEQFLAGSESSSASLKKESQEKVDSKPKHSADQTKETVSVTSDTEVLSTSTEQPFTVQKVEVDADSEVEVEVEKVKPPPPPSDHAEIGEDPLDEINNGWEPQDVWLTLKEKCQSCHGWIASKEETLARKTMILYHVVEMQSMPPRNRQWGRTDEGEAVIDWLESN